MNKTTRKIIHLFVFDSMATREASLAIAAINSLQMQSGSVRYRVVTAAASLAPVITVEGACMQPEVCLEAVTADASAMLILPGGRGWETGANANGLIRATQFVAAGVPVAAIGGAAVALARAAFLDQTGRRNDAREYLISSGGRGTSFYCGLPVVGDGQETAPCAATPVDFAREIFRMIHLASHAPLAVHPAMFRQETAANGCTGPAICAGN